MSGQGGVICLGDGGDPTGSDDDHSGVLVSDQGLSSNNNCGGQTDLRWRHMVYS